MDEKLIQEFIQWLPQNIEEFANKSPEEIITTINALSKSEDGVKMLQQLITTFQQSKSPNSFKLGGKIEAAVVKFQKGGLTRKQALANYMANNEGATRSQARQAYRNAKFVGKYNIGNNALKNDGYQNNRDWARQLISGQTTNSNEPKVSVTPTDNLMTTVGLPKTIDIKKPVIETNHNGIDLSNGSFNDAFAAARRQGLDTFRWNGGLYGTKLKDEVSTPNSQNITVTPKTQTPNYVNNLVHNVMSRFGGTNRMSISSKSNETDVNQNPDSEIIPTSKGVVSIRPNYDWSIPANTSGSKNSRVPVTFQMRGGHGRYSIALQDGGKFNSLSWPNDFAQRHTERGSEYYISNADTLDNTVRRVVKRPINGGWATTEQYQIVGDPSNTYYKWYRNVNPNESDGYPLGIISRPKKFFDTNRSDRERNDKIFKDLYNY